jgi:predicted nucleic acid-binding protein
VTFVVDASVAVKWFVAEEGREDARRVLANSALLIAPDLILTEIANALRKKVAAGEATSAQAHYALARLPDCFLRLAKPEETLLLAFDISLELRHPFADCVYLACAAMNDAILVTDDRKFLEKAVANGHGRRIVPLGDWRAPKSE